VNVSSPARTWCSTSSDRSARLHAKHRLVSRCEMPVALPYSCGCRMSYTPHESEFLNWPSDGAEEARSGSRETSLHSSDIRSW